MKENTHIPVLLDETIKGLDPKPGSVVFDGTLGGGGHAQALCNAIGQTGLLIGTDADAEAIKRVQDLLSQGPCRRVLVKENFRRVDLVMSGEKISKLDAVLLDLGMSSNSLENSGRGFSFQKDEPLLMTYTDTPTQEMVTATDIVNTWEEKNIADVLFGFAGERYSRRIAHAICEARKTKEIKTTGELSEIITSVLPLRKGKIHPATKTFQALRMAVNDEVGALHDVLSKGWQLLSVGGKMAVISFHEVEDRIVKQFFKSKAQDKSGLLITKKPIVASREEMLANPRARSAKLRIVQKIS